MTAVGLISYSTTAGTRGNNLPPKTFNAKPGVVNQPATSKPEVDTFTRTLHGDKSKKIANDAEPLFNFDNFNASKKDLAYGAQSEKGEKTKANTTGAIAYGKKQDEEIKVNTTGAIAYGAQNKEGTKTNINTTGAIAFGGLTTRAFQSSYDVATNTANSYSSTSAGSSSVDSSSSSATIA